MNFKNLRFYTVVDLTDVIDTLKDDEKIEDALEKAKFTECPRVLPILHISMSLEIKS